MQLIGQKVQHQVFGTGVVTDKQATTLKVRFPAGEKMFMYPDAFTNFLVLTNQEMQGKILGAIRARDEKAHEQEMIAEEKWRREANLRNMRISARSQAVFDIEPRQLQEQFESWTVSTGVYSSGYSKGEPRVPDRMKPNSMCMLTVRPEGMPEAQRRIVGLFMAEDTFEGSSCVDGVISAHPVYRLRLEDSQQVLFWPYVTQEENKKKWGNTTLKYLPNTTAEKILRDVRGKMENTENAQLAEEFYQYYCRLNRLQPTKISE